MSGVRIAHDWLAGHGEELVAVRRHLHAHPELSGAEHETTAFIADRLRGAGLSPQLLPGTGLICDIEGSRPGPTVVLRADLDALPVPDAKDVPYRSQSAGVSHACGHDVHTAVVLGAGLAMAAHQDAGGTLPGQVRLLFQAAEEQMPGGALDAIDAGAVEGVDLILALHCDPTLTVGRVGLRDGAVTAAADQVRVRLSGPGGHTSRPDRTVDLIGALAGIATQLPQLLNRRLDARHATTLVWGTLHAGRAPNAIPDSGELTGTVRTLDADSWRALPGLVEEIVPVLASAYGATAEVRYQQGVPPVVNDPRAVAVLVAAADEALGAGCAVGTAQSMGGEDFAWYLERVPGAMARLGTRPVDWAGPDLDLHQGVFDVDESSVGVGVRLLVTAAVHALGARSD